MVNDGMLFTPAMLQHTALPSIKTERYRIWPILQSTIESLSKANIPVKTLTKQ